MKPHSIWLPVTALAMSLIVSTTAQSQAPSFKTISIPSTDGLDLTADLFVAKTPPNGPVIICFHQARSSRGEYRTIAPKLLKLGYTVLAPDQRSGKTYDSVNNETARRAKKADLPTAYRDALPDLRAAIGYVRKTRPKSQIIIWGSSYSASLVLKLAAEPGLADVVLAFSPGEYFGGTWIRDTASRIKIPTFITSARGEAKRWDAIFNAIGNANKTGFIPNVKGRHGSSALHPSQGKEATPYWQAVTIFLKKHALVTGN